MDVAGFSPSPNTTAIDLNADRKITPKKAIPTMEPSGATQGMRFMLDPLARVKVCVGENGSWQTIIVSATVQIA